MADLRGRPTGRKRRIVIVASRFNQIITDRLIAGARACLIAHGVSEDAVDVFSVPGAWELPWAARLAADTGRYDAVVAVGCVIRGDTAHFEYVAGPAAEGLARVALDANIPVTFGVLTTETAEQAWDRAGGSLGNKGWEAAEAALELVDLRHRVSGRREDA